MTFRWPNAGKYEATWLPKWNATTQQITYPSQIYVYQVGTTNRITLYTDRTRVTTAPNNPVTVGVADNAAGLSTQGNLICYAEPGEYDLLVDGVRFTVSFRPSVSDVSSVVEQLGLNLTVLTTGN